MGRLDYKQLEQLMLTQLVKKFLAPLELENPHLSNGPVYYIFIFLV